MIGQAKKFIVLLLLHAALISGCSREADVKITEPENDAPVIQAEEKDSKINTEISAFKSMGIVNFTGFLADLKGRIEYARIAIEEEEKKNPYSRIPPDETGKIMILMFHNFIEEYEEGGDKTITTTLSAFRSLLEKLYAEGYRTASLSDFIGGSISVQRGCKPIIFTFDDGKPSQFSLIENPDGTFSDNPKTAVAVMEQFYNEYPDFGLNGTFFLNLGFAGTFGTVGTLKQRLEAIAEKGFELESHAYNHPNLAKLTTPAQVMEEIGKNAKKLNELLPGRTMSILALPYGNSNKALAQHIESGSFEGFEYKNKGIMLVGAEPAVPMYFKDADPVRIRRIIATGIEPVDWDFDWWYAKGKHEYISDGNPDTISVPSDKLDLIDGEKIKALDKELVIIEPDEDGELGAEELGSAD